MKRRGLRMLLLSAVASGSLTANAARADVNVGIAPTPTSPISEQVPLGQEVVTAWRRGETRRMYVRADNNGPEIVDITSWRPGIPANLQAHLTCANSCVQHTDYGKPIPSEDFFSGVPLFIGVYSTLGGVSGAITNAVGGGAQPGHSGNLGFYDLTVGNNAPLGRFDFSLDVLDFGDDSVPDPNTVGYTRIENYSFNILPRFGDANNDTFVDANDVAPFVQAMMDPAAYTLATGLAPTDACDMNGDGQADGKDIQDFVERIINGP